MLKTFNIFKFLKYFFKYMYIVDMTTFVWITEQLSEKKLIQGDYNFRERN